jgi:hypothetical protein
MSGSTVIIKDYRLTIPAERFAEMQHVLEQAARAGQSPHPLVPGQNLPGMLLVTWGLDAFANRPGALTVLHIPRGTALSTLDTFLNLIARFVAPDQRSYFDVVSESEDGEREFFYRFRNGGMDKEERIVKYVPAQLELIPPREA